ncbi:GDSL-type esterase/lipase family protein [Bradyrhizobium liaoningense]
MNLIGPVANLGFGVLGGAAAQFTPQAVVLEGDTYSVRSSALTGAVAGPTGAFSLWVSPLAGAGAIADFLRSTSSRVEVRRETNNTISIAVSAPGASFKFSTVSTTTDGSGWVHICGSWNTNAAAGSKIGQMLKNGTSDYQVISDASAAFSVNYADTTWAVGATNAGANKFNGMFKEMMLWAEFIDWSNPANLAKVYNNGAPVDPGADGSRVTGNKPLIYLSARQGDLASAFLTNRGSGGDFAQTAGAFVLEKRPIIGYGDSLMYGTAATVIPNNSWHFLLCRSFANPYRRLNFGVGGETIAQIEARFETAVSGHVATYPAAVYALEGGYNSKAAGASAIISKAIEMRDDLLAIKPGAQWFFVGIPNGGSADELSGGTDYQTIVNANAGMASAFGSRFIDVRSSLISNGLAMAGITPTSGDNDDIAADMVPRSLRDVSGDTTTNRYGIHWNDAGHAVVKQIVKARCDSLGIS